MRPEDTALAAGEDVELASKAATEACHRICEHLDGLNEEDARDAVMNAMGRVLLCQAGSKTAAFRQIENWRLGLRDCVEHNWANIMAERAQNGGRQPTITKN